ncbi:MAG TPA: hypothetical protein VGM25_16815 [Caulobacteraceae bacterium]|jgi:hypothetical protein
MAEHPPGPDDHLESGPRKNTQFGQEIGVDDTSPPEVAHGQRVARESRVVDDGHGGRKASFLRPMDHRPPPQEASEASEFGAPEPGPPSSDAALPDEGPSAWDASPPEAEDEER